VSGDVDAAEHADDHGHSGESIDRFAVNEKTKNLTTDFTDRTDVLVSTPCYGSAASPNNALPAAGVVRHNGSHSIDWKDSG